MKPGRASNVSVPPPWRAWRRLALLGAASFAIGLTLHILVPVVFGRPRPVIAVAWDDSAPRIDLARRFSLVDGRSEASGFWSYAAYDTSSANLRALVEHPAVTSTRGIAGDPVRIAPGTPVTPRRDGWVQVPRVVSGVARRVAWALMLAGGLLIAASRVRRALNGQPASPSVLRRAAIHWISRGIPMVPPQAAAAFRIVFAVAMIAFFATEPVYPELLQTVDASEVGRRQTPYSVLVAWLASRPGLVDAIDPLLFSTGALVAIGAFTRVAYAAFVAGALLWSCVYTVNFSAHTVAALQLTLIGLLFAPWHAAWSVDAWAGRRWQRRPPTASSVAYGFTFWLPTFVLGVTLAAAAWSKVRSGPGWIVNGTVKYHFLTDLDHAWVDWGLQAARHPWLAIALSAGAVLVESLVITAAFSRSYTYRAAAAAGALLLFSGFVLFQGIVWFGWWILLLGFLPWHWIRATAALPPAMVPEPLPRAGLVIVLAIASQQVAMSAWQMEGRPFFSAYDMYSATYDGPEDYEAASNLQYRVVALLPSASIDLPGCVLGQQAAAITRRAMSGAEDDRVALKRLVAPCVRDRRDVRFVMLEGDRRVFDWAQSRFIWKRRLDSVGPVDLDWLHK